MFVLQREPHTQAEEAKAAKQPRLAAFFGPRQAIAPPVPVAKAPDPEPAAPAIPEAAAQAGEAGRAFLLELALLSVPVDDHR